MLRNPLKNIRINEFSKVTGHKINIYISIDLVYTSNEQSKNKIKKTNSFAIASKENNS